MGVVNVIIEKVQIAIKKVVNYAENQIQIWRDRLRDYKEKWHYRREVSRSDFQYRPEQPDVDALNRANEYLSNLFPNGIQDKVSQMSDEELLELFKEIEKNAEKILGVTVDEVTFYSTDDYPECYYCGCYSRNTNSLYINVAFILSKNPELIEEQVYTIFHELKHARQWAAVVGTVDYGYSEELLRQWAENFKYYISPPESDEAYRKQPVELDTFGFENSLRDKQQNK